MAVSLYLVEELLGQKSTDSARPMDNKINQGRIFGHRFGTHFNPQLQRTKATNKPPHEDRVKVANKAAGAAAITQNKNIRGMPVVRMTKSAIATGKITTRNEDRKLGFPKVETGRVP